MNWNRTHFGAGSPSPSTPWLGDVLRRMYAPSRRDRYRYRGDDRTGEGLRILLTPPRPVVRFYTPNGRLEPEPASGDRLRADVGTEVYHA